MRAAAAAPRASPQDLRSIAPFSRIHTLILDHNQLSSQAKVAPRYAVARGTACTALTPGPRDHVASRGAAARSSRTCPT